MKYNEMKNISEKVKYIIDESGYNMTQFASMANKYGYPLTRQTLSSIINDKNPYPSVQILNSIIQVCHKLENEKLRKVTFDFLLNDDIEDIEAINANLHYELGLSEASIKELQFESYPFVDNSKEIDYFIYFSRYKYWQNLARIRLINNILQYKKIAKVIDAEKIKEKFLPLTKNTELYCYLNQFHNELLESIKKLIVNIDNLSEDKLNMEFMNICDKLSELNNSFKYDVMKKTEEIIDLK